MPRTFVCIAVLLVAACNAEDDAALEVSNATGTDSIAILLNRSDPGHSFGSLHATVNGIALAAPTVMAGGKNGVGLFAESDGPTAEFDVSTANLGNSVFDVTVTEDDETFHLLAPELLAPRAVALVTPIDHALLPGATVEVTSGVASDSLDGRFVLFDAADNLCTTSETTTPMPDGGLSLQLGADTDASDWFCDTVTAGSLVDAQMSFQIVAATPTTCDGPSNLTCDVSGESNLSLDSTVAVQVQL